MAALGLGATFPTHGRSPMDASYVGLHGSAGTTSATCASAAGVRLHRDPCEHEIAWSWACDRREGLGVPFNRIGFSYVMANNGLRGVRLVTEFPF